MATSDLRFRIAVFVLLFAAIAPMSLAATPDYSGTYASVLTKKSKDSAPISLRVVQNEKWIEIIRTAGNKVTTGHCRFDGAPGPYTNAAGNQGTCTAELKRGVLIVVSIALEETNLYSPITIRMRRRQEWKLAADGKSLTINFVEDSPDAKQTPFTPGLDSASAPSRTTDPMGAPVFWTSGSSWKEKYQRTD